MATAGKTSATVPLSALNAGEAAAAAIKKIPPRTIKLLPEYKEVADITVVGGEVIDWNDEMLFISDGLQLGHLELEELSVIGDYALRALVEGMSECAAGSLLLIAWNLFSTSTPLKRVFPAYDETGRNRDVSVTQLSDMVINPSGDSAGWGDLNPTYDHMTAACYIAASLIRLVTKEADSYMKAIPHLIMNFHRMYRFPFPLPNFTLNKGCIESLRSMYQAEGIIRNTVSGFLYHYGESLEDVGLCRMLYEQHLSYTGLHAFPLFAQASVKTHLTSQELLSALDCRLTRKALKTLAYIINEYESVPAMNRERKTYKYARIFESGAFVSLQTKNCPELVCILAHLCRHAGTQGAGNILDIAVVKQLSEEAKRLFEKVAKKIFEAAMFSDEASGGNPMFDVSND